MDAGEAARLLSVSPRTVRNLVGRGALEGKREGEGAAARLVVSVASIERLHLERQAAGEDPAVVRDASPPDASRG